MKKRILVLLMSLCLLLSSAGALAEEAAYTPGELTQQLFADAWNAGQLISGDLKIELSADPQLLLSTYAPDVDPSTVNVPALLNCLKSCVFTAGAAKTQDGVLVALEAKYAPTGASSVGVTAAVELTPDGLSIESDLIEGQKVTAAWETLLALAGADQTVISTVTALKTISPEELLAQIEAMLPMIEQTVSQLAAPYGQVIVDQLSALEVEQFTDVPADEDYPAAATLTRIPFTLRDVGNLICALADQLEQDATLAPMLDAVLAQTGSGYTTAQLCGVVRSLTAMLGDDLPLFVDIGMDENGTPLYVELYDGVSMGANLYAGVFVHPSAEYPGSTEYWINFTTSADGENADNAFYAGGLVTMDPSDPYTSDFSMSMGVIIDGVEGYLDFGQASYRTTTDENRPCVASVQETTMTIPIDPTMDEYSCAEIVWSTSADGSEWMYSVSTTAPSAESEDYTSSITQDFIVYPDGGGLYGSASQSMQFQQPTDGVRSLDLAVQFSSEPYAPAQKAGLALETVSSEDMAALQNAVTTALTARYQQLLAILPDNVAAMLMGE